MGKSIQVVRIIDSEETPILDCQTEVLKIFPRACMTAWSKAHDKHKQYAEHFRIDLDTARASKSKKISYRVIGMGSDIGIKKSISTHR